MTTEQRAPESDPHIDVAAYALGLLDPAEATAFEEHLAGCDACADELDSMVGLESILAEYGAAEPQSTIQAQTPAPAPLPAAEPPRQQAQYQQQPRLSQPSAPSADDLMLDALIGKVAASRKRSRLRRMYALAAAIVLIIGGPVVASVVTSGSNDSTVQGEGGTAGGALPITGVQHSATDAATGVSATVGLVSMKWGTHVAMKLSGVHGPLTCDLVAVSKTGQRQVVATWMVPSPGYGVTGAGAPLVLYGGAGMPQSDIDHFDVQTTSGQNLVTVPV